MAAAREIMWMCAISSASEPSASRIFVVPSSFTPGTYRSHRSPVQRLAQRAPDLAHPARLARRGGPGSEGAREVGG
ncbi:hypothetical protein GCM10017673_03390 [Streptosporangium violaceochromogenes]|nr:hypothetical protein GCM10017673_03390 [Streptosporangium violaceochromogenes]